MVGDVKTGSRAFMKEPEALGFFFQAEDGIRDIGVTGVQTCALPIFCEVARQPSAHGYQPTIGTPELREAMADFYSRWYGVDLNPASEIQPLIGSKEGILHVTLAFVNPGEEVLVPNPGYPTYTSLSTILDRKSVV